MSELYFVVVDSVEGSTLRAKVHLVHPDVPYVPQEAIFPVNLLGDAFDNLERGFATLMYRGCAVQPLTEEQGRAIAADLRLRNEFLQLRELVFGAEPQGTRAEEYSRRVAEIVTSYSVGPYQNVPLRSEVFAALEDEEEWNPNEPDGPAELDDGETWHFIADRSDVEHPYAEIVLTVSDPGYLEHLSAGMRWGTAAFEGIC